jgi:hypothetical protein
MNSLPLDYTRCSSDSCILRAKCLRWTDTKRDNGSLMWFSDFTNVCESGTSNHFILDERKQPSD